jgi:hypothetical protein
MRSLLLLTASGLLLSAKAEAQPSSLDRVLKHVPGDAAMVVVIPDMGKLVTGLAAFGRAIEVGELADIDTQGLAKKLCQAELIGGMSEELHSVGSFVLAMGPEYSAPVVIFRISDPAGLAAVKMALEVSDPAGQEEREELARVVNHVVIVGKDEDVVEAAASGDGELVGRLRKELYPWGDDKSALLFVDVPAWKAQIEQGMRMAETFLQMSAAMGGAQAEAGIAFWKWVLDSCRTLVGEAQVYTAAVRVGTEGIFAADLARFEPDGQVAGYLKQVRKSSADLLRGLPADRPPLVFGCEWLLPEGSETLNEKMARAMLFAQPAGTQPAEQHRAVAVEQALVAYRYMSGYSGIVTFGPEGKGICVSGLYLTEHPKRLMENVSGLAVAGMLMRGQGAVVSLDMQRRQETVGGVRADVCTFTFGVADEQMRAVLELLYGESMELYAAPRPEGVSYTLGPVQAARTRMEKLLSGGGGKLSGSKDVAATLKAISPGPQMCVLADLAPLFEWFLNIAVVGGAPVPQLDMPDQTAYVAFGLYLERDTVRAELWVPAEPIKALIEAVEEVKAGTGGEPPY